MASIRQGRQLINRIIIDKLGETPMFKKPEHIKPLPAGMTDAFSKTLARQGFVAPVQQPASQPKPLTEGKMSEIDDALRSMSDKDFKIHYKMTKAEMRLRLKGESVDEAVKEVPPSELAKSPNTVKGSKEHKLGVGVDMKQMMQHAKASRDIDMDGDVDKLDKSTPDEITGAEKKDQTPKMMAKYAKEKQHTKVGNAFESVENDICECDDSEYNSKGMCKTCGMPEDDGNMAESSHGHESMARSIEQYISKHYNGKSGLDTKDFMKAADMVRKGDMTGAREFASTLDTDPRDKLLGMLKHDMAEALDPVDPKTVHKPLLARKDRDIDNNGKVDDSDNYIHKRRQAIARSLAIHSESLHPDAHKVLKHIKPEHQAKYTPDLTKKHYTGSYGDRSAVLNAAKRAGHLNEDARLEESWEDMMKASRERNKPQQNGGAGKKQGTAYGGSKQKDAPSPKKEAVEEELSPAQKAIDKNKNGKIDGQDLAAIRNKKKPQGADFAAARRKERMDKNGRMDEEVKVGDKVSFDHPMSAIPGKTMKKIGTVKSIEGDTAHLKSSTKYGTLSYQKKVSELRKEEVEQIDETLDEGKYSDDDWVIMKSGGTMNNPKKDTIVGYRKAGKGAYSAPKTEPGQKAMRISVAKQQGYAIGVTEETAELAEAPNYKLYHTTFSAAVQEAIAVAKKQGYEVDEEDYQNKVAIGPKKPSKDKTNSYSIDLTKGGSPTKKKLQIQVYNMGEKYELNTYVQ
jgi:hypothetical protein